MRILVPKPAPSASALIHDTTDSPVRFPTLPVGHQALGRDDDHAQLRQPCDLLHRPVCGRDGCRVTRPHCHGASGRGKSGLDQPQQPLRVERHGPRHHAGGRHRHSDLPHHDGRGLQVHPQPQRIEVLLCQQRGALQQGHGGQVRMPHLGRSVHV